MAELLIYNEQLSSQLRVHPGLISTFLLSFTSYELCLPYITCSFPKLQVNVNVIFFCLKCASYLPFPTQITPTPSLGPISNVCFNVTFVPIPDSPAKITFFLQYSSHCGVTTLCYVLIIPDYIFISLPTRLEI